jgi:hypothetical protein
VEAEARAALLGAVQSPSPEEVRLLPLIYRRLFFNPDVPQAGASHAPRATAARLRRAWVESRAARAHALRQLQEVLAALTPEMPVAPLKGLALDAWYGCAGRPIGDLDLLVPERLLGSAMRRLEELGYRATDETNPRSARAKHSCAMAREGRVEVDVHWLLDVRLAGASGRETAMARLWRHARPVEWAAHTLQRLRGEHHLLHAVIHGARVDSRAQARWAVDAIEILRREGADFDWDELLATTRELGLAAWVGPALQWLDHLLPDLVPAEVQRSLRHQQLGVSARCLWWLDSHALAPGVALDVQRTLRWHLARTRGAGLVRGLLSYPRWLVAAGLVRSPGHVLAHWQRRRRERRERARA